MFLDLLAIKLLKDLRCGVDYCICYYLWSTNMGASAIAMIVAQFAKRSIVGPYYAVRQHDHYYNPGDEDSQTTSFPYKINRD